MLGSNFALRFILLMSPRKYKKCSNVAPYKRSYWQTPCHGTCLNKNKSAPQNTFVPNRSLRKTFWTKMVYIHFDMHHDVVSLNRAALLQFHTSMVWLVLKNSCEASKYLQNKNIFIPTTFICRCDRIIWFGQGMKQINYERSESRLSDHRPVRAMFIADIKIVGSSRWFKVFSKAIRPRELRVHFLCTIISWCLWASIDQRHSSDCSILYEMWFAFQSE